MSLDFKRPADPPERPLTVAELNRRARSLLEQEVGSVWIEAEVVDATRARSGHRYFTLADSDGKAQISAVMWKGQATRYGSLIERGVTLLSHGRVTLYEPRGSYQLVVDRVEEAGAGLKARRLAELRAKLEAEGLFDPARKRPLPPIPRCVGVVTSRSGAAIRDVIKVASRRFPVRLLLAHAQVQGESASAEIVAALERLAEVPEVEVVIVGRGGGSSEDLDAFNSEMVIRAVAAHPVPVVSAVGHEIDVTLVDLAADRRAATPSEAAEIVAPEIEGLLEQLADARQDLATAMRLRLSAARDSLARRSVRLRSHDPRMRLRQGLERLSLSRERLARWPERALSRGRGDLAAASEGLHRWPEPTVARARGRLGALAAQLDALSPLASLARGYSIVRRRRDRVVVREAGQAPPGEVVDVTLARGSLECTVDRADTSFEIKPEDSDDNA
ncbi:MAG: exodeoxyribonuclease VII large subunit [Deltaproteobacteria bacterium]|nr:exodeoxyribonuclease VII large subunit [Deltaproteobacteria bacterium]